MNPEDVTWPGVGQTMTVKALVIYKAYPEACDMPRPRRGHAYSRAVHRAHRKRLRKLDDHRLIAYIDLEGK